MISNYLDFRNIKKEDQKIVVEGFCNKGDVDLEIIDVIDKILNHISIEMVFLDILIVFVSKMKKDFKVVVIKKIQVNKNDEMEDVETVKKRRDNKVGFVIEVDFVTI